MITGALSALGCATLAPDAVVHPLLPHDADVVLEGTGADLVLIEAAALLPGAAVGVRHRPGGRRPRPAAGPDDRHGPLPRQARVLVRNVPPSLMPGLGWLAASCDAVVDGGLGVQLARFNPIGVTAARPTAPVYAGASATRARRPRCAPCSTR